MSEHDMPKLWLEYANLNRKDFSSYDGSCRCFSCEEYRKSFREWAERKKDSDNGR